MITLAKPIAVKEITSLEVRSVKFERNLEQGTQWVDVWCDYGFLEGALLRSYSIPGSGSSVLHLRFENGMHPAKPGRMLGKCRKCGSWVSVAGGICPETNCDGVVDPYAAYDELMADLVRATGAGVLAAVENHLTSAVFPSVTDLKSTGPLVRGAV